MIVAGFFDGSASAFIALPLPVAAALLAAGLVVLAAVVLAVCGRLARRRRDRQLDAIFRPVDRRDDWRLPWHEGQKDIPEEAA